MLKYVAIATDARGRTHVHGLFNTAEDGVRFAQDYGESAKWTVCHVQEERSQAAHDPAQEADR